MALNYIATVNFVEFVTKIIKRGENDYMLNLEGHIVNINSKIVKIEKGIFNNENIYKISTINGAVLYSF